MTVFADASAALFHAGADYPVTTPPPGLERGPEKQCFATAAQTAIERGYRYCEGYALYVPLGLWVHHAWNLTPEGEAFDLTWEVPGARYVGQVYPAADLMAQAVEQSCYNAMAHHVLPLLDPGDVSSTPRRASELGYPPDTCRVIYRHGDRERVCARRASHAGGHSPRDRERFPEGGGTR
jgi:hypothetical protein